MSDRVRPAVDAHGDRNLGLWIGVLLGAPIVAYGIWGALDESGRTQPAELARWVVGGAVVHDLVVFPIVVAVGSVVRRFTPAWVGGPMRWALATSAALVVFAYPLVRGFGRARSVPSLLSRDYGIGLLAWIAVVWALAVAVVLVLALRRRATDGHAD